MELAEGCRVDLAGGMASGAVGAEAALRLPVEDCLGEDGAGGVAGAEEEDVAGGGGCHDVYVYTNVRGWDISVKAYALARVVSIRAQKLSRPRVSRIPGDTISGTYEEGRAVDLALR